MGEKSKLIGEYGEKAVENFLKLIGWGEPPRNIEFHCSKDKHKKQTHGLDFFYAYKSPLVDSVLKRTYVSVKFTTNPYPNSPVNKFKEYYEDLVTAIECFRISPELREITSSIKNYSSTEDVGVLFWLTNDDTSYEDLIPKISSASLSPDFNYHSFYIIDNKRIDFTYLCLKFAISKFHTSDITFFYPDTGKNIIPTTKKNYGKVLPIEYINSSILPLRIEDKSTKQTTLVLFTIDPFALEDLKRLIGLAQEICKSWTNKILICFPDYNEIRHSSDVRIAKGIFEDESLTNTISVGSYNDDFKSLQL